MLETTYPPETYAGVQATISGLAASAFERHELTILGENEWRCGRPKSGTYAFRVIIRPGVVIFWGDLGPAMFFGGEAGDTLAWLREAVHSPSYLLEKHRPQRFEFYPGDALAYAKEAAAEGDSVFRKVLPEALDLLKWGNLNAQSWAQLVYDCGGDGECAQIGHAYEGHLFWVVAALRWLVEHLPPVQANDNPARDDLTEGGPSHA